MTTEALNELKEYATTLQQRVLTNGEYEPVDEHLAKLGRGIDELIKEFEQRRELHSMQVIVIESSISLLFSLFSKLIWSV